MSFQLRMKDTWFMRLLTADLGSGDEDREELCVDVLDPTDMECGENGEYHNRDATHRKAFFLVTLRRD